MVDESYDFRTEHSMEFDNRFIQFHDWQYDNNQVYILEQSFIVGLDDNEINAIFVDIESIRIQSDYGFGIELLDPWQLSEDGTQENIFIPIIGHPYFDGSDNSVQLFMNHAPSEENPYYSIRVDSTQFFNGVNYLFDFWNGSEDVVHFSNASASTTAFHFTETDQIVNAEFSICGIPGNANMDDILNVLDLTTVVAHIMEEQIQTDCPLLNADYNHDGLVNVNDVVGMVNDIMEEDSGSGSGQSFLTQLIDEDASEPILEVYLLNEGEVKGLQFDCLIPDGFRATRVESGDYAMHMDNAHNIVEDGQTVKNLHYSELAESIQPGYGLLLRIYLEEGLGRTKKADLKNIKIDNFLTAGGSIDVLDFAAYTQKIRQFDAIVQKPEFPSLLRAYPNPFNNSTKIEYALSQASFVRITLFDINGKQVEALQQGEQGTGMHSIHWNAEHVASGIYYLRLETAQESQTIKLQLVK